MKSCVIKLEKDVILELLWIPPGEFIMGSPETEIGHEATESRQHRVRFTSGFWMGRYPLTQQQWQAVMGSNPSRFVDPCQPAAMVSWFDAQEFINRINEFHQGIFRLPSEAEWEYACRGGTTTRFYSGEGEREPNSFGLYDMHGNVFEWTADWYGPYTTEHAVDPVGPPEGAKRVLRGGCCLCDAQNCRASNRYAKAPDGKNFNIGLRFVMSTEFKII